MRRVTLLALLALAVLAAGCSVPGGEVTTPAPDRVVGAVPVEPEVTVPPEFENGDPVAGKEVFAANGCAACHTLSDAGAAGTVGPNLDEAKPDLALSVDRVLNGKGAMQSYKGTLTTQQIADVAAYVVQATSGS